MVDNSLFISKQQLFRAYIYGCDISFHFSAIRPATQPVRRDNEP
jgi:hypothetical protein